MGSIPGLVDEKHSNTNSNDNKRSSASSSQKSSASSSTRSSSPSLLLSPSSPASTGPPSSLRSMDDLWRDINLSSLHPPAATASSAVPGDAILEDFLGGGGGRCGGGPFNKDPTPISRKNAYDPDPSSSSLGLASGSGLRNREKGARFRATSQARSHHAGGGVSPGCNVCTMKPPSHEHVTPSAVAAIPLPLKRKSSTENNSDSNNQRFQRLMKNRESAERSRARKQAYMMELEIEVGRLHEENDRLRREQKQLLVAAAAAAQLPKKLSLRRTFTSPF